MSWTEDALGYTSFRVQRAHRINNMEQVRLQGRLQLLEKEKVHAIRVTNNDIRLISLTLDYIQSSSGKSVEGRAPDAPIKEKKEDQGPFFLYGERIVSRKVRRFQRPQSAFDRTSDQSNASSSSTSSTPVRPQSSPAKRKPTISWNLSRTGSVSSLNSDDNSTTESTRPVWQDDTDDITKRILRLQDGKEEFKVALHEQRIGHLRGQREKGKAKMVSLQDTVQKDLALQRRGSSASSRPGSSLNRNANLSEILNQRRPTLSASTWKKHLTDTKAVPMSFDVRSQNIRKEKLQLNYKRQMLIQKKINSFRAKYPFKK